MNNGDTTVNGDMLQKTMGNGDKFWDKIANNDKIFYTNASSLAIPAGTVQVLKEFEPSYDFSNYFWISNGPSMVPVKHIYLVQAEVGF